MAERDMTDANHRHGPVESRMLGNGQVRFGGRLAETEHPKGCHRAASRPYVVMVGGTQADAEALWDETSTVLAEIGLCLSVEKTRVCHIDEGFDFLGCRIQRRSWRGRADARAIYIYPSKRALLRVMDKIRDLTHREKHRTLADLLLRLNPVLRGWCNYFRHGAATQTFSYLDHFTWWRVVGWIRKRHNHLNWGTLCRRHLPNWEIRDGQIELFRPRAVPVIRHRYRGEQIPTPWTSTMA